MTTVLSLTYMRPKAQVRPSRHSRAMAPITQDLKGQDARGVADVTLTMREQVFSRGGNDQYAVEGKGFGLCEN